MPVWIAGALAASIAVGSGLGALLARPLARGLGLAAALATTAVLMGESILGAGLFANNPDSPNGAIAMAGITLVSYAIWARLARTTRQRIVPAELLSNVTGVYRAVGAAALAVPVFVGGWTTA